MTALAGAKAAGHRRDVVRELGYPRDVCARCRVDWPCPVFAQAVECDADPYANAVLVTGNGGRTWHRLRDNQRTECGQRPGRWAYLHPWDPAEHNGRTAPHASRICARCRLA